MRLPWTVMSPRYSVAGLLALTFPSTTALMCPPKGFWSRRPGPLPFPTCALPVTCPVPRPLAWSFRIPPFAIVRLPSTVTVPGPVTQFPETTRPLYVPAGMSCGLPSVPPVQLPAPGFAAAAIDPPTASVRTTTSTTNEILLICSPSPLPLRTLAAEPQCTKRGCRGDRPPSHQPCQALTDTGLRDSRLPRGVRKPQAARCAPLEIGRIGIGRH